MMRVNLILAMLLVLCALGTVTAQHRARTLYQALEAEQSRSKALDTEYNQLLIELSTWAVHTRIEEVATERLRMRRPPVAEGRSSSVPEVAQ